MKLISFFLFLTICGFTSANIFNRFGFQMRSILKKHVTLDREMSIKEAPYIAAIIHSYRAYPRNKYMTASIITNKFLISAPIHPVYENFHFDISINVGVTLQRKNVGKVGIGDVQNLEVYVGHQHLLERNPKSVYEVEEFIPHYPHDEEIKHYNNVLLIKVKREIEFNAHQKPIALLTEDYYTKIKYSLNVLSFKIVGYGATTTFENICMGELKSKNLEITQDSSDLVKRNFELHSGHHSCGGDMGTPAILDGKLAAVFSSGIIGSDFGSFTGIISQYDWIAYHVGIENLMEAEMYSYQEPRDRFD